MENVNSEHAIEKAGGNFMFGSFSGYPGVEWVIKRLGHVNTKKITLALLAIVPGKYAEYELLGDNPQQSWKNVLESSGYEVIVSEKKLRGSA